MKTKILYDCINNFLTKEKIYYDEDFVKRKANKFFIYNDSIQQYENIDKTFIFYKFKKLNEEFIKENKINIVEQNTYYKILRLFIEIGKIKKKEFLRR
jgi:hypothetical protein